MDVRPIRTETDHQAALAEIATLMNAGNDTPEGDRLDVLATLVEAYEAAHLPINAPDPGGRGVGRSANWTEIFNDDTRNEPSPRGAFMVTAGGLRSEMCAPLTAFRVRLFLS